MSEMQVPIERSVTVRPGDTLIVALDPNARAEDVALARQHVMDRVPVLADVVFLAGARAFAVVRADQGMT